VPLAELFGYATAIRSLSKGPLDYSMEPSHFEPVPANLVADLDQKEANEQRPAYSIRLKAFDTACSTSPRWNVGHCQTHWRTRGRAIPLPTLIEKSL